MALLLLEKSICAPLLKRAVTTSTGILPNRENLVQVYCHPQRRTRPLEYYSGPKSATLASASIGVSSTHGGETGEAMPLTDKFACSRRGRRAVPGFCASVFVLWLGFNGAATAVDSADPDVVTMRNGDIHNGTIVDKILRIQTRFGIISLPKALTARIEPGDSNMARRLTTRFGDIFYGELINSELTMVRILDTPLPLKSAEISDIVIAARRNRAKRYPVPDTVATIFGDLFSARIATRDFMLKEIGGIRLIRRADIHLMDIHQPEPGSAAMAQLRLNGGSLIRGELMTRKIELADRFGNSSELPVEMFASIAFQVNYQKDTGPRFNYLSRWPEASHFRDRMRDGSAGPEMVALRGGEFRRGDLQGDGDSDEKNPQTIRLRPFAIGIYEVSFDEYDRFSHSTRHEVPEDQGWGRGRRPVINVSWDSANAFTDWLSQQTGESYRLPTDAEWEYAARGGTSTRFWWGDREGEGNANCAGCQSLWDGEKSSPVGKFEPNPFGLHDTAGNVFEWVADCWNDNFSAAPADGGALDKPGCGVRVIRGGAWSFPPKEIRSANRWRDFQSRRSDDTGFRIVRELNMN